MTNSALGHKGGIWNTSEAGKFCSLATVKLRAFDARLVCHAMRCDSVGIVLLPALTFGGQAGPCRARAVRGAVVWRRCG